MATGTTESIDNLIEIMNVSESILRSNSIIENDIRQGEGTIIYSYNNIIVASEISDSLYTELEKNSLIDYIEVVPLKSYGQVNYNLINQLDISNISASKPTITGFAPTIINDTYSLTAYTNEQFSYSILGSGTTPIIYQYNKPTNYNGQLSLNINTLTGKSYSSGNYNVTIRAINNFGIDTKELNLIILENYEITNTNLNIYNKLDTQLYYSINSTGDLPKEYYATNLPSGITLSGNILSGTFVTSGIYDMIIGVTGATGSDSKNLLITVGTQPIITSSSSIVGEENSGFTYTITSTQTGVTYNVFGDLPKGLTFKLDTISGLPTDSGIYYVTLSAINAFGQSTRKLTITIYNS